MGECFYIPAFVRSRRRTNNVTGKRNCSYLVRKQNNKHLYACKQNNNVREFRKLSGVFYCRIFPLFSDEKRIRFFWHIYNEKLINIEMNYFVETMRLLSDNITFIIHYILNQSERIGTYYLRHNSISLANKKTGLFNIPLYRRILGKLRLNVRLRSFPFLFVFKFLHFMTIRNRGPPFFHDYRKDNQENMEDKS